MEPHGSKLNPLIWNDRTFRYIGPNKLFEQYAARVRQRIMYTSGTYKLLTSVGKLSKGSIFISNDLDNNPFLGNQADPNLPYYKHNNEFFSKINRLFFHDVICPKDFNVYFCSGIGSLEGSPISVGGHVNVSGQGTNIITLNCPNTEIIGNLILSDSRTLSSLKGFPKLHGTLNIARCNRLSNISDIAHNTRVTIQGKMGFTKEHLKQVRDAKNLDLDLMGVEFYKEETIEDTPMPKKYVPLAPLRDPRKHNAEVQKRLAQRTRRESFNSVYEKYLKMF